MRKKEKNYTWISRNKHQSLNKGVFCRQHRIHNHQDEFWIGNDRQKGRSFWTNNGSIPSSRRGRFGHHLGVVRDDSGKVDGCCKKSDAFCDLPSPFVRVKRLDKGHYVTRGNASSRRGIRSRLN